MAADEDKRRQARMDEPELSSAQRAVAVTVDAASSSDDQPARIEVQSQTRIDRFFLLRQIGEGGMGMVYAAFDERLDRRVAIKLLNRIDQQGDAVRQRTLMEARALAKVSHPYVVSVYEVGEHAGQIFIAMEFVDGMTLRRWQAPSGRTWQDILAMYIKVGEGLAAAHAAEIVHRDFKPENVLVGTDDRPRVADFGLARMGFAASAEPQAPGASTDRVRPINQKTAIAGTPGYMSPEQYANADIDPRSDQFSYCVALYEALYGHLPYSGETVAELSESVRGRVRPPAKNSTVPEEIHRALLRGLSFARDARFASMKDLLRELSRELGETASAGQIARQRTLRIVIAAATATVTVVQVQMSQKQFSARSLFVVSVVMLSILLGVGLAKNRALLRNRFHRRVWTILTINMGQVLLNRLIGLAYDRAPIQTLTVDLVMWAAMTTVLSVVSLRSLRFLPPLLLLLAAAAEPLLMFWRPLLPVAYLLTVSSVFWVWSHAGDGEASTVGSKASRLLSGRFQTLRSTKSRSHPASRSEEISAPSTR
jgi:predicted Ser/Thr protein kinase